MMNLSTPTVSQNLLDLINEAKRYSDAAKGQATNTEAAYAGDFRRFEQWCQQEGLCALPADTRVVAVYLAYLARDKASSTVKRALWGINAAHKRAGYELDTANADLQNVLEGIHLVKGDKPEGSAALLVPDLKAMLNATDKTARGYRDRALILTAFAGALRRSEVVSIDVEHLRFETSGVRVYIPRSKTDQKADGAYVSVPVSNDPTLCPVRALKEWLTGAGITKGPVFRRVFRGGNKVGKDRMSLQAMNLIIKEVAERAGVDESKITPHSLRAGLITSAHLAGKPLHDIMQHSRHKSQKVASGYIRSLDPWQHNVAGVVL